MDVANEEVSTEVKHLNLNSGRLQGLLLFMMVMYEISIKKKQLECCSKPTDLLLSYNYREHL